VLVTANALYRCFSPLHIRRLHHEVRSDDDLVEFARFEKCLKSRTKRIRPKPHDMNLAGELPSRAPLIVKAIIAPP
jgi:hypothetical protein